MSRYPDIARATQWGESIQCFGVSTKMFSILHMMHAASCSKTGITQHFADKIRAELHVMKDYPPKHLPLASTLPWSTWKHGENSYSARAYKQPNKDRCWKTSQGGKIAADFESHDVASPRSNVVSFCLRRDPHRL